jgi:predicted AlkP superfamily phosphohydrolase/phosphomutase
LVLVCSDHGHGPVHELVRVNGLLADLGFLQRGGVLTQAREAIRKWSGKRKGKGLGIAVDWETTRAYMPFEAIAGFIFLNRRGREPFGMIEDTGVQALAAEIRTKLLAQKSPHSGRALFDAIIPLNDAYPQRGEFDFPELFALAARGVNFVRKLSFGPSVEIPDEKYKGTHRPEGFYTLHGAGVCANKRADTSIADVAPTVLAALGQPVPSDMNGRVWSEFFSTPLDFKIGEPSALNVGGGNTVYSDAERAVVEQRLADLGYVD